jgi:hypothetical protein
MTRPKMVRLSSIYSAIHASGSSLRPHFTFTHLSHAPFYLPNKPLYLTMLMLMLIIILILILMLILMLMLILILMLMLMHRLDSPRLTLSVYHLNRSPKWMRYV